MKVRAKNKTQLLDELSALKQQIARLEDLSGEYRAAEVKLTKLANFPEQNPDILIEVDVSGRVTYLNPVAQARFPELWHEGFRHPLLQGLPDIVRDLDRTGQSYSASEINLREAAFERQTCYAREPDAVRIRVYVHDITRRKRAELAVQKLAKQVVYAQEEERQRLSRELHDEAGQALTALKLSLELLQADLPVEAETLRRNLGEAIALTESTKERVRVLAQGLRPPALDTVGLNLTLEAFCRDFSRRTQLSIQYRGCELKELSDAMNICLYRVLQEALTNIVKHAHAHQVDVNLSREARNVRLTVADNGRGFDTAVRPMLDPSAGIGLLGMRERLELLGGWLEVESAPGRGLRLAANLPMDAHG